MDSSALIHDPACRAPFVTMSFQIDGRVFVCCRKPAAVVGDTKEQSLREIWDGSALAALREDLGRGRFPGSCAFCERFVRAGAPDTADLHKYAKLSPASSTPLWPQRLEFNLSNLCNLECQQCCGELSSRIRARREALPPLPQVYGERFFGELDEFLPHLEDAVFLGGEPLLQEECLRIIERMGEIAPDATLLITTNGTVLTPRVENALRGRRVRLTVSIDAVDPELFESIRLGARFESVRDHVNRFARLIDRAGSQLLFAYCPMQDNWRELPKLCRWADEIGARILLNPLTHPPELSLFALPDREVQRVADELERQRERLGLGWNDRVLVRQIRSLRAHLEDGGARNFWVRFVGRSASEVSIQLELHQALLDAGIYEALVSAFGVQWPSELGRWGPEKVWHAFVESCDAGDVSLADTLLGVYRRGCGQDDTRSEIFSRWKGWRDRIGAAVLRSFLRHGFGDDLQDSTVVAQRLALAMRAFELGDRTLVCEALRPLVGSEVGLPEDRVHGAHLLRRVGEPAFAEAILCRLDVSAVEPEIRARSLVERGWASVGRDELDRADHLCRRALSLAPAAVDGAHLAAWVAHARGDTVLLMRARGLLAALGRSDLIEGLEDASQSTR